MIGPEKYNELYEKFGNLNSAAGLGARARDRKLLAKKPDCPRALSDKFADARVIENSLLQHGRTIKMEQRTKAESDPAVAAASILARDAFVDWLEKRSRALGVRLGRGVSAEVKKTAQEIVATKGAEVLEQVAKVHFRTAHEIAPDHFAAPPPRREWRK